MALIQGTGSGGGKPKKRKRSDDGRGGVKLNAKQKANWGKESVGGVDMDALKNSPKTEPRPYADDPRVKSQMEAHGVGVEPVQATDPQAWETSINLRNLATAYYNINGVWPSSTKAYMLLNADGKLRSPQEWQTLLAPGKGYTMPANAAVSPQPQAPQDPLAIAEDDLMGVSGDIESTIYPVPQNASSEEVRAADTGSSWTAMDSPWSWGRGTATPQPDAAMVDQTLDKLTEIRRIQSGVLNPLMERQEEQLMRSPLKWKETYAERMNEYGIAVDFDADEDKWDIATDTAYRLWLIQRQLPYYLYGDVEQQAKAKEVIARATDGLHGGVSWDLTLRLDNMVDTVAAGGVDSEKLKEELYQGWQVGRGLTQTTNRARADFVETFGVDKLPWGEVDQYQGDLDTLNAVIGKIFKPIGDLAEWGTRKAHKEIVSDSLGYFADKAPGSTGAALSILQGELDSANEYVAERGGVFALGVQKANQIGMTFWNMVRMADESWIIDEDTGRMVRNPDAETESVNAAPDPLRILAGDVDLKEETRWGKWGQLNDFWLQAESWSTAWNNGEKQLFEEMIMDTGVGYGIDETNPGLNAVATLGNLTAQLKIAGMADNVVIGGAVKGARGTWNITHNIAEKHAWKGSALKDQAVNWGMNLGRKPIDQPGIHGYVKPTSRNTQAGFIDLEILDTALRTAGSKLTGKNVQAKLAAGARTASERTERVSTPEHYQKAYDAVAKDARALGVDDPAFTLPKGTAPGYDELLAATQAIRKVLDEDAKRPAAGRKITPEKRGGLEQRLDNADDTLNDRVGKRDIVPGDPAAGAAQLFEVAAELGTFPVRKRNRNGLKLAEVEDLDVAALKARYADDLASEVKSTRELAYSRLYDDILDGIYHHAGTTEDAYVKAHYEGMVEGREWGELPLRKENRVEAYTGSLDEWRDRPVTKADVVEFSHGGVRYTWSPKDALYVGKTRKGEAATLDEIPREGYSRVVTERLKDPRDPRAGVERKNQPTGWKPDNATIYEDVLAAENGAEKLRLMRELSPSQQERALKMMEEERGETAGVMRGDVGRATQGRTSAREAAASTDEAPTSTDAAPATAREAPVTANSEVKVSYRPGKEPEGWTDKVIPGSTRAPKVRAEDAPKVADIPKPKPEKPKSTPKQQAAVTRVARAVKKAEEKAAPKPKTETPKRAPKKSQPKAEAKPAPKVETPEAKVLDDLDKELDDVAREVKKTADEFGLHEETVYSLAGIEHIDTMADARKVTATLIEMAARISHGEVGKARLLLEEAKSTKGLLLLVDDADGLSIVDELQGADIPRTGQMSGPQVGPTRAFFDKRGTLSEDAPGPSNNITIDKDGNIVFESFDDAPKTGGMGGVDDVTSRAANAGKPPGWDDPMRPNDYRRLPVIFRNMVEVIAWETRADDWERIIQIFGVSDDPAYRGLVKKMAATEDPQVVREILMQMKREHAIDFDPTLPGIYRHMQLKRWNTGLVATPWLRRLTPIALHKDMEIENANEHLQNLGVSIKFGRREMTRADAQELKALCAEMADADGGPARQRVLDKFWKRVKENMDEEGTWDSYQAFKQRVARIRADHVLKDFDRWYAEGDKALPAGYTSTLHARLNKLKEELVAARAAENITDIKDIEDALKTVEGQFKRYADAAKIIKGHHERAKHNKQAKISRREQAAYDFMDGLSYSEPVFEHQMRKGLRNLDDPRALAHYQGGTVSQYSAIFDARVMDRMMRFFKTLVMSNPGFPVRVLAGDEGMRLISEGLVPGTERWRNMMAYRGHLKGGREVLTKAESGPLLTGKGSATAKLTAGKALSKAESKELKALDKKADDLTDAEKARQQELTLKEAGTMSSEVERRLYENVEAIFNERFTDEFRPVAPGEAGFNRAFAKFANELKRDPVMKAFFREHRGVKTEKEIRDFLFTVFAKDNATGQKLRFQLADTGRITAQMATKEGLPEFRRALRSIEPTGVSANLTQFIDTWTDIIYKVNSHDRLAEAMRSGRNIDQKLIGRMDTDGLWMVPTNDRIAGKIGNAIAGQRTLDVALRAGQTLIWPPKFYENVTMRMLEFGTNRLREAFFSDAMAREISAIRREAPDLPEAQVMKNAERRAMNYVNRVTFTRNPSVLEDALRNWLPFVNSYRQFAMYWGKMKVRHPMAMSVAYNQNPLAGNLFTSDLFGGVGALNHDLLIPAVPFWTPMTADEQEGGALSVVKNNLPSINPYFAYLFAGLAPKVGISNIEDAPFMHGATKNMAPLAALTPLYMGITGKDVPFGLGKETAKYRRDHLNHLRYWSDATGEPVPMGDDGKQTDYPWYLKPFDWAGAAYPELVYQAMIKQYFVTSAFVTSQEEVDVIEGMRDFRNERDPAARAKMRKDNEKLNISLLYHESSDLDTRLRLLQANPWLKKYATSNYDYSGRDGETIGNFGLDDFIADLSGNGTVRYLTDVELEKSLRDFSVRVFGGYAAGSTDFFPGSIQMPLDEAKLEKDHKAAIAWARSVVKQASSNPEVRKQLMAQFRAGPREDGRLPGIFQTAAEEQAKRQGKDPREVVNRLSAAYLDAEFAASYEEASVKPYAVFTASETELENMDVLSTAGVLPEALWEQSAAENALSKHRYEKAVNKRKGLIEIAQQPLYDLTAQDLVDQGFKVNIKEMDAAIVEYRDYYYNVYDKVHGGYYDNPDHGGYELDDVKQARNALHAFKDKLFKGVKGGDAIVGGIPERIASLPYFNTPRLASVGAGPTAEEDQKTWEKFLAATRGKKPDMKLVTELKAELNPSQKDRWAEVQRVADMLVVTSWARWMREAMKRSYSEYYEGKGNSVYTKLGERMVAKLDGIMKKTISEETTQMGFSKFEEDITTYFDNTHDFAYKLLEWYSH